MKLNNKEFNMKKFGFLILFLCLFLWVIGCSDSSPTVPHDDSLAELTCIECHTDQARLTALATTEVPSSGEAGEG